MSQAQPSEELYPYNNNPVTSSQPQPTSSSNSSGSFGPVFAVLAVIVVISAVACVLGRFCNKRRNRFKESSHHNKKNSHNKQQSHHHGLGPQEWESKQKPTYNMNGGYGDIELGFGKGKFSGHDAKSGGKGKPSNKNGGHKQEVRFDDDFSGR